jgi:hypothetical protein
MESIDGLLCLSERFSSGGMVVGVVEMVWQ